MTEQTIIEEAERRYPALNPDADEITYPRSALRSFVRSAFAEGGRWQEAQSPSLPTREQIAKVIAAASDRWRSDGSVRTMMIEPYIADAVLALLQKADDR